MRVCLDIQAAVSQGAGVGRFTRCLAQHLAPLRGDDDLDLCYFDFKRKGLSFDVKGAGEKAVRWIPGRTVQQAWRRLGWPPYDWFAGSADLYHFTNFIRPPLSQGRSAVTIYDVSFLRHPEAAEPKNLAYLTKHITRTTQAVDAIFTITEFSANEIHELLNVERNRIHVTYPGVNHTTRQPTAADRKSVRSTFSLDRPYLLFVSTIEPRKNIPFLVDLFDRMDFFDGDLVLAGMKGWKVEPILEHLANARRRDRIKYVEFVPDNLLPALYAEAELFVFPSLYEGFGFPPLEAMMYHTPVVSSAGGSLPEALGSAAEIVDGFVIDAWLERIRRVLTDSALRDELRRRGDAQVRNYSWEETARQTWQAYRQITV